MCNHILIVQVIMEGLLLGDIAHMIAAAMLARSVGGWSGANVAGAVIAGVNMSPLMLACLL